MYHQIVRAVARVYARDLDGAVAPLQAENIRFKTR